MKNKNGPKSLGKSTPPRALLPSVAPKRKTPADRGHGATQKVIKPSDVRAGELVMPDMIFMPLVVTRRGDDFQVVQTVFVHKPMEFITLELEPLE